MPYRPNTPCRHPGCAALVLSGQKYCDRHKALHPEEVWYAAGRDYGAAWQKARKQYLEVHPLCVECMKEGQYVKATVVDHIVPHRGDQKLFRSRIGAIGRPCASGATIGRQYSLIQDPKIYFSSRNPKYLYLLDKTKKVPLRKKKKVSGLTREAVKVLLAEPDTTHKTGIRDLALMVVLYATAARIDEILSICVRDLIPDVEKPYVVIVGKGEKVRTLYLLSKAAAHIKLYIKVFHGSDPKPDSFLFFSRNKGIMEKFSQSAVRKMMKKYAKACHDKCEDVP